MRTAHIDSNSERTIARARRRPAPGGKCLARRAQPTEFELVIDLRAAAARRRPLPAALLARVDTLIRRAPARTPARLAGPGGSGRGPAAAPRRAGRASRRPGGAQRRGSCWSDDGDPNSTRSCSPRGERGSWPRAAGSSQPHDSIRSGSTTVTGWFIIGWSCPPGLRVA